MTDIRTKEINKLLKKLKNNKIKIGEYRKLNYLLRQQEGELKEGNKKTKDITPSTE